MARRVYPGRESSCSYVRPSRNLFCNSCTLVRDIQCSSYTADVVRWISCVLTPSATKKRTTPLCSSLLSSISNAVRTHFALCLPPALLPASAKNVFYGGCSVIIWLPLTYYVSQRKYTSLRGAMGGISVILAKNNFFVLLNKCNLHTIIYYSLKFQTSITALQSFIRPYANFCSI